MMEMKRRKKLLRRITLSMFVFIALCIVSGVSYGASTGAAFLKIGVGARPIGMGGAFVAVADDANAVFWNPAGLSKLNNKQISAMHTEWISDVIYDYVGYVTPLGNNAIGISAVYLSSGYMEKRDSSGDVSGSFSAYDASVALSYARKFNSVMSLGVNVKLLQQKIGNDVANGVAIDIGQIYNTAINNLNIGLAVQNIGPDMKFIEEPYSLPLTVLVGAGYRILGGLTLGMDVKHQVIDNRTSLSFGTEYLLVNSLALRAGYLMKLLKSDSDVGETPGVNNDLGRLTGIGAGLGFRLGTTSVDYAFVPYGDLGNTHRISFLISF